MARIRTGKKLLKQKLLPHSFFEWVLFILALIGRQTYKGIFKIITISAKTCYYSLYTLNFLFSQPFLFLIKTIKKLIQLIKQLKIPLLRIPEFKFKINKKKVFFLIIIISSLGLSFDFYINIFKGLPEPDKLITRDQIVSTKIYDRHHQLLFTIFNGNQNRTLVKLKDIPSFAKQATIAIEDQNFYQHPGFSIKGISRALLRNFFNSETQGGSTITQQLIKNALLNPEKTWRRKIKELILSIQVELIFSKDDILQMYFNEVPYGGTAYGIEEAAQTYFGKSVKNINLAEAALLAGLPAAPTKYSPFGVHPQLALKRQHQVLNAMVKQGYINRQQADQAKKEKIILKQQQTNIKAPHFVMFLKDLLVEKYGPKKVEQGGLEVITSLDLNLQNLAQNFVTSEINKLTSLNISNGAALVTNPQTGEILAMVGSRNYFDRQNDGNVNVTIMPRQPGSSIKIINYAVALENGFTPATIISDTPITYKIPGTKLYSPVNYDRRFHGNVTLRTALACSYNIPAVKTLATFGVNKMIDKGEAMGITTWKNRSRYGLALTLGAGEVKMTDMAVAYGVLANLGKRVNLNPIIKITDYKNRVLDDFAKKTQRVLDPKVAYLLTDILKDNQARIPAFGQTSYLVIPGNEVAVKTGTTNNKRDNWTIGYTQDFLTAVWVGNNDNSPMNAVASGITGASPIWNHIMKALLKDKPNHHFKKPEELVKVKICSFNGLLACEGCADKEEYFIPGTEPKYHCNSKEIKKILERKEEDNKNKILQGVSVQQ